MNRFQSWYYRLPPALRTLMVINVSVYAAWVLLAGLFGLRSVGAFVVNHLALNPGLLDILFEPWQLLTYNFLHLGLSLGGFLHILFNMLWLYWIGQEYEEMHGSPRMVAVYVLGGLGGGVLTVLLHTLFPGVGAFGGPVHGASAAVLGLVTAVAVLYPYKQIALFLFGTIRLAYIVIGFLVIDALISLLGSGSTSVSAHWGGALAGFLFAKAERGGVDVTSWAEVFFDGGSGRSSSRRSSRERPEAPGLLQRLRRWVGAGESPADASASRAEQNGAPPRRADLEKEVDRILDKISEQGYEALSDEEKETLQRASQS